MSIGRTLTARLRGGLGNQMFQYAAARALADELGMDVVLDTRRGFQTDKVYRRTYALGKFPIRAMHATRWSEWPYAIEGIIRKLRMGHPAPEWVTKRPWGYMLTEREYVYFAGAFELKPDRNIWMNGFWQSEKYFASRRDAILRDFELPEPESRHCLEMARRIEGSNAVAVGVRLFEEMPATDDRSAVGGVVPWSYYERAARLVCEQLANPTFFVFCTKRRGVEGRINLPGEVHYVTADEGFGDEFEALWLFSRCRSYILSNSTFYWWGAWLGEGRRGSALVIARDQFPNKDAIPARWIKDSEIPGAPRRTLAT